MLRPSLCPAETDSVSSHSSLEDIGVVAAVGLNIFFLFLTCLNLISLMSLLSTHIWGKPSDTLSYGGSSARLCHVIQILSPYGSLWETVIFRPRLNFVCSWRQTEYKTLCRGTLTGWISSQRVSWGSPTTTCQGAYSSAFFLFPWTVTWRERPDS